MLLPHNAKKLRRKRTELLIRFPGNSVTPARAPAMQGFVDVRLRARRDQRSLAPSTLRHDTEHGKSPRRAWVVLPTAGVADAFTSADDELAKALEERAAGASASTSGGAHGGARGSVTAQ